MSDKEVRQAVLDLLEVVPLQTLRIALLYARNYAEYGEDVTKTWATATEQSAALEGARNRGYYDGVKSADAFKAKAEVVIEQLRADRDRLEKELGANKGNTKETLKALMADMERIEPNTEDGENIKRTCICMVLEYWEGED